MARKKLAVLGHSAASWTGFDVHGNRSFIDKLINHFAFQLVAQGVLEGSEERILDTLKNMEPPDLCIIFHSGPQFLYLPGCDRDIDIKKFRNKNTFNPITIDPTVDPKSWLGYPYFEVDPSIAEKFQDDITFRQTILLYKRFLYTPELHQSKFFGTALQIDQYCLHKNIRCIHVPFRDNFPQWLQFSSGKLLPEIQKIANDYAVKLTDQIHLPNNINPEGQMLIYQALAPEIEDMISAGQL